MQNTIEKRKNKLQQEIFVAKSYLKHNAKVLQKDTLRQIKPFKFDARKVIGFFTKTK